MSIMSYRDERINFELIKYGNWEQIEIFSKSSQILATFQRLANEQVEYSPLCLVSLQPHSNFENDEPFVVNLISMVNVDWGILLWELRCTGTGARYIQ